MQQRWLEIKRRSLNAADRSLTCFWLVTGSSRAQKKDSLRNTDMIYDRLADGRPGFRVSLVISAQIRQLTHGELKSATSGQFLLTAFPTCINQDLY